MAITADQVIVELQAKVDRYNANVANAERQFSNSMQKIGRNARLMESTALGAFQGIATAFAGAAALRGAQQLIDASTRIQNSLKVTGLAGEELRRVYDSLFASAQRNVAPLESLTTLYSRLSLSQQELGVSNEELLNFTDKVALALRVQGTTAQEASGALLQLSQAMGGGVVRAEEFNSIVEGAPTILRAAAAGLEEAGGSVAKLRQIVIDGKLSSEAFFRAFEAGSVILEDQVAGAGVTVAQGLIRLQNVLIDAAGKFDDATGASEALGNVLLEVSGYVSGFGDTMARVAAGPIPTFIGKVGEAWSALENFKSSFRDFLGLTGPGGLDDFLEGTSLIDGTFGFKSAQQSGQVIDQTFRVLGETPQDQALLDALSGDAPSQPPLRIEVNGASVITPFPATMPSGLRGSGASVTPVSMADYPVSPGTGGGGRGGRGKSPEDTFEKALNAQRQRNAMLMEETALQSTLNPLVEDYGFAIEKLKVQQELENAATRAGLELTPDRKSAIEQLAEGYAQATAEAERLNRTQEVTKQAMADFSDLAQSSLSGFISDLRNGKSAAEALGDALGNIGDKLLDLALSTAFGGGGGFNILSLFGFAKGGIAAHGRPVKTFARGGVSNTAAIFGEDGPEAAVPLPDGRSIPVDLRMPSMSTAALNQQMNVHVTVGVSADSAGNLTPFVESVSQRTVARAAPALISTSVAEASKAAPGALARYQQQQQGSDYRG
jgi:tape measure domain-containing protein